MKRKTAFVWLSLFVSLCYVFLTSYEGALLEDEISFSSTEPISARSFDIGEDTISIGMWNIQIFGMKKIRNETLVEEYVDIINDHDIFIIQEIRDNSGVAFETLCDELRNYSYVCLNSSRAGRSSSKEQYGFLYRDNIELVGFTDYNPAHQVEFERPPFEVEFGYQNTTFSLVTIHTKPGDVVNELAELDYLFAHKEKTIIIGDLNADCSYYQTGDDFIDWMWIIRDDADSTVRKSDCAYDRILFSPDFSVSADVTYGITTEDITTKLSDHYPIWVAVET